MKRNGWVVIVLLLMTFVVVGRHIQRLGGTQSADESARPSVLDPLGVQEAHAEPLPPVESGAQDALPEAVEGGALGVPEVVAEADPDSGDEATATPRQRVPLNPEPPLPEKDRPRRAAPQKQGPLTELDPHQMLFEPGEKGSPKPAPRRSAELPRPSSEARGPVTDVDPRQMLFEPDERAPKGRVRKTPVETRAAEPPAADDEVSDAPSDVEEPAIEPSTDAQRKAEIMKRLLRVMELAGEKP